MQITLRKDQYSGFSFLKCDKEDLIQSGIAHGHFNIEICSFRGKITEVIDKIIIDPYTKNAETQNYISEISKVKEVIKMM